MHNVSLLTVVALLSLGACTTNKPTSNLDSKDSVARYGQPVAVEKAVPVANLGQLAAGKDSIQVVARGTITDVCQAEGCWVNVATSDGKTMLVRFRDHKFLVPKDVAGQEMTFTGTAYVKTFSVEYLRHLAEDSGKPQSEIDKITQPETKLTFAADGVELKKK